jgi:8-amino-7-oxononanoate synthase
MADSSAGEPLRDFCALLERELIERGQKGLTRKLSPPEGIDFTSNDYLGLSRHAALAAAMRRALESPPYGAPSSRLLRGHLQGHQELEERFAAWKGTEAALLFPTGYAANLGVLGGLIGREDCSLSDELNHASIIDGLRLTGSRREVYPHLDLEALERLLRSPHPGGRTFVVTETLFSMEGDRAPLGAIADLCDRHGALLVLDDAHGTGLYGPGRGSGLAEEAGVETRAAAIVSTCGKALGLLGAFAAGPRAVIERLVNTARSFIFTTSPPPVLVAGIRGALDLLAAEPGLRGRLHRNAARLRRGLAALGVTAGGEGPIAPIVLGENERALSVAAGVRGLGYDVRAVRPPSVPAGTARIRISVHADHREPDIDGLCRALAGAVGAQAPGGNGTAQGFSARLRVSGGNR